MRLRRVVDRGPGAADYAAAGRPASSTPWRAARWCAIDLELTGLDPRHDHIISIGLAPIEDGRVMLGQAAYTLVNSPRRSQLGAILLHKLRTADVAQAPSIGEAMQLVLGTLAGRVPVCHTAAVERAFLRPHLKRYGLKLPPVADTEVLGRLLFRDGDGRPGGRMSLTRVAERLGQGTEAPHHALGDALMTAQAFIALASRLDAGTPQTVGMLTGASELLDGVRRRA
jgi:DNA polymerase III subunit epsilon